MKAITKQKLTKEQLEKLKKEKKNYIDNQKLVKK